MAQKLNRQFSRSFLTGAQLREIVVAKWGRSYEVRLQKRGPRMYLQVRLLEMADCKQSGIASSSDDELSKHNLKLEISMDDN